MTKAARAAAPCRIACRPARVAHKNPTIPALQLTQWVISGVRLIEVAYRRRPTAW